MKKSVLPLVFAIILPCLYAMGQDNESGAVILNRTSHITIKGSKLTTTDSVEILILDRRGDRFSNVSIPFTEGEKFTFGHAEIKNINGATIRSLKKKEIKERNYFDYSTLYSDILVKYFSLRHNVYPYILSYSYTQTTDKFISLVHNEDSGEVAIRNGKIVLETPSGYDVLYTQSNTPGPHVENTANINRYTWEYSSQIVKEEIRSSAHDKGIPVIKALPRTFKYGVEGSWESWESFGNWLYKLNDGLDQLPSGEMAAIDRMLEGIDDKMEKIRTLYYYMQDKHRYINVKIDIGGLKSYPASYVCQNRFGDCKALCNYFRAVLKYAGIESYYTVVNLDDQVEDIDESFPHQAFNHVILTVPTGRDTLYLECTSANTPLGYVGTSIQGRKALLTKPAGSHLINIPPLSAEDVSCTYRYDLDLTEGQGARVSLGALLKGWEFAMMTFVENELTSDRAEMFLRHYSTGGSFTMDKYNISRADRDSPVADFVTEGTLGNFWRKYGNNLIINTFTFAIPANESLAERKYPVRFDYPVCKTIIAGYDLSAAASGTFVLPQDKVIESRFGAYRARYRTDGNKVTLTKQFTVFAGTIPIEDYGEWHAFITEVRNHDNSNLNIEIL